MNPRIATKNLFFAPSLGLLVEEAMRREYEIQPLAGGIAIYADALRFDAPPIAVVFARAAKEANEPQKRHSAWITPAGELHYPEGYETPAQFAARIAAARKASRVRQQAAVAMGQNQGQVEEDAEAIGLTPTGLVNLRTYWADPKAYKESMGGWDLRGAVTPVALAGALAFLARGDTTVVFGHTADAHNARHIAERVLGGRFEFETADARTSGRGRERQWAEIEAEDARRRAEGLDTEKNWTYRHPIATGPDDVIIVALNHMTESREEQTVHQQAAKARQQAAWTERKAKYAAPPPKPLEERAVAAVAEFIEDPENAEKGTKADELHRTAYYGASALRKTYHEAVSPILLEVPAVALRGMIKALSSVPPGRVSGLQPWLRNLLERYDGRVRWMRKEYLTREDGQAKHATIGTRVVSLHQRQVAGSTQGEIPAGWHGVVEASGASDSRAKAAVGTMSALQVRFDPEVVSEEPAPEKEAPARKTKASPGTSRLGVALLEEPWNQEIVWVVDAADRDGKPTERHWRPKGWPLSSLYVQDSRQDASLQPRGRYKVQFIQRGVPADAFYGGMLPDAANREYLKPGMGFDTLEGVRGYLKEHWELNQRRGDVRETEGPGEAVASPPIVPAAPVPTNPFLANTETTRQAWTDATSAVFNRGKYGRATGKQGWSDAILVTYVKAILGPDRRVSVEISRGAPNYAYLIVDNVTLAKTSRHGHSEGQNWDHLLIEDLLRIIRDPTTTIDLPAPRRGKKK